MGLLDLIGHKYPFTDFHELNLDWCITAILAMQKYMEDFTAGNKLVFADPLQHDLTKTYSKNTIVIGANGNAYLSLQPVPVGVALTNTEYWLMVFDFTDYSERANKNFTDNYFENIDRSPVSLSVDDWIVLDDILYKVISAISPDDLFEVGVNIVHFTIEQFLKDFVTYVNNTLNNYSLTIQQYKNDIDASELQYKNEIDASELAYRNQLAHDIADTTASLQAQLDAAIAGVTVDSEVINARVGDGLDALTYPILGDAIRSQFNLGYLSKDEATYVLNASINEYEYTYKLHAVSGDIDSDTGKLVSHSIRIATDVFYFVPDGYTFKYSIPSTYRTRFYWYEADNGALTAASVGNVYGEGELPVQGKYFRFIVVRTDSAAADPSEIDNIKITIQAETMQLNNYVNKIAVTEILDMLGKGEYHYTPPIEIGGVDGITGNLETATDRVRTYELQYLPKKCTLHYSGDPDYRMRFFWYSGLDGTYVGASAVNLTGEGVVPRLGDYFRYIIYNPNVQPPVDYDQHVDIYFEYDAVSSLLGKTVSIMGDSLSTYGGSVSDPNEGRYSPAGNPYTYPGNRCRYPQTNLGVTSPDQTYWLQTINHFNMKLGINDSWAGTKVSWDGHTESGDIGADKYMGSQTRIDHLDDNGTPDFILVVGGTNDIYGNVPLGEIDYSDPSEIVDYSALPTYPFADAYRTMLLRMMHTYPNARIICMLPNFAAYDIEKTDKYCEIIKELCDMYGLVCFDTRSFGITPYNKTTLMGDSTHYNAAGMNLIAKGLENSLFSKFMI